MTSSNASLICLEKFLFVESSTFCKQNLFQLHIG